MKTAKAIFRMIPLGALTQLQAQQCGIDRTYAVAWIRDVKGRTAEEAATYGAGFEDGYRKALIAVSEVSTLRGA